MSKLAHYQKYQRYYEIFMVVAYFLVNTTILATSIVMENMRGGINPDYEIWQPFALEYSSGLVILLLIPAVVWLVNRYPPKLDAVVRTLLIYLAASVVFSLAHVSGMTLTRELIWWLYDVDFVFGNLWYELLYEYRKDLLTFLSIVIVIKAYKFTLKHLMGEAAMVPEQQNETTQEISDRLLVKKLGSEFIIRIDDIEWLEASGNYVNLHIGNRIYPLRSTLSSFVEKISDRGFARIHRSHAVKLDEIQSMTPLATGDSEIMLRNGKILNLSRRYKESLRFMMSS